MLVNKKHNRNSLLKKWGGVTWILDHASISRKIFFSSLDRYRFKFWQHSFRFHVKLLYWEYSQLSFVIIFRNWSIKKTKLKKKKKTPCNETKIMHRHSDINTRSCCRPLNSLMCSSFPISFIWKVYRSRI